MTEAELRRWSDWAVETCLLFGASLETALIVAAHFVAGLQGRKLRA